MKNNSKIPAQQYPLKASISLLLLFWTAVLLSLFFIDAYIEKKSVLREAYLMAGAAFDKDIQYRRWNASHGGVYVPVTETTQPNPYLNVPARDVTTTDGTSLTLINPAYMTRQVHELALQEYGIKGHITSMKPIRPQNSPDPWEEAALKSFERGADEASSEADMEGEPYLRFMRPLMTEKRCLKCHEKQGYREGDLRGGISVSVPLKPYFAAQKEHVRFSAIPFGLIWVAGLVGIVYAVRRVSIKDHLKLIAESERKRAEQALTENEFRLRTLLQTIPDLVWLKDGDGIYLACNSKFERLYGAKEADIVGRTDYDFVDRELADFFREHDRKAIAAGKPSSNEEWLTFADDGHRALVETIKTPMLDAEGRLIGVLGIARDITARRKVEAELREKLEMLERFHNVTVDRELQMIELKKEINSLLKQAGKQEKYRIEE